ncbi:P-loop containing nucleoside triphosphate hydrolase protein [Lojkania enalia]|uniref:P-loop containing nucleoside triphosphate hydrolase protein n=1 Tax=Lojkania enalia TaxID=147567 RepID=A0A9P4JXM9_9PLEO|nr:P-loop containing nucleoside triphosphate hydrolase protein [Didymosphaeria enalia]
MESRRVVIGAFRRPKGSTMSCAPIISLGETGMEFRSRYLCGTRGTSRCIAAAIFHSSPSEDNGGSWNYTLRAGGALGTNGINVDTDSNDAQIYILPFQHSIDSAIGFITSNVSPDVLSRATYEYPFTSKTHQQWQDDNRLRFMNMIKDILATPFYLSVACILYQMAGFVVTEREIGMARLLDTMMPNRRRWLPQVARIVSHYIAFDILYAPGWIVAGAILGARCFLKTVVLIPILFNMLAGLSTTSLAIFAGSFFRNGQLRASSQLLRERFLLGKSTTLDAIAGISSISSGDITLGYRSPHDSFGYCPQMNILWDELTVEEHVKIFDRIKSLRKEKATQTEIKAVVESCDLTEKAHGLSKSLSGGQKRKFQLAMMFAGGSTVCCVDGVSSGVGPISRRKLWDILLPERGHRSIILTTHFLDEADLLSDRVAILSNGLLKATATSVELKQIHGGGYRTHDGSTVYFTGSSADTSRLLRWLELNGVQDYQVNGPTLEDVFFRLEENESVRHDKHASFDPTKPLLLKEGSESDEIQGLGNARGHVLNYRKQRFSRSPQTPPGAVTMVDTQPQFDFEVGQRFADLTPGGFFLGDQPTIAWRADGSPVFAHILQNLVNNQLLNITVNSSYEALGIPFVSNASGFLLFIVCFGLSTAVFPAFMGLYPTIERLRGIRAMHYSNGVHVVPLWLSYILFDFLFIASISIFSFTILAALSPILYANEYLLLILLLSLATFTIVAASQAIMFLIYFVVFIVVSINGDTSSQKSTLNIVYLALGLFSPAVSLSRSLFLASNAFGVACRDKRLASYPGAIDIYGGSILYLCLQSLALFANLIWRESGWVIRLWPRRKVNTIEDIELNLPTVLTYLTSGLRAYGLQKRFGKHIAVDEVSFGILRGECFALVGPNGAAISTTISMIRGDLRPRSRESEIVIDGILAMKHRSQARPKLGVCPQIDPLDNMTVNEHLLFYAKIRALNNAPQNVKRIMKTVGIEQYADRIATKLSGGNKRKLSLGIALIGSPSVLLLDEPSSGMDAVSKRVMWRTLSSIMPGRSLLLTTHSMEEANALTSSAGIIAGRMLASGTIEYLRRRYGDAYFVHLVHMEAPHTGAGEMEELKRWVQGEFPEAKIDRRSSYGQVKFELPFRETEGIRSLADVFARLEAKKKRLGVEYYSVSTATLDQIFLSVVGMHAPDETCQ